MDGLLVVLALVVALVAGFASGWLLHRSAAPADALPQPAGEADPADLDPAALLQGLIGAHDLASTSEPVRAQVEQSLRTAGVQRIVVRPRAPFDAAEHAAVATEPAGADGVGHCVAREVRAGWRVQDRVVRPAEVVVWTS